MRTQVLNRKIKRGRPEMLVLDCLTATPEKVGFPGAQTIAQRRRRVRRKGQKTTAIVYFITCLTLDQLAAAGLLNLKRGYWVIESRFHHSLDVALGEDPSRVHHRPAAFALSLFRRVAVSFAQVYVSACKKLNPQCRATTRQFQERFHHHDGGREHLQALIFAKHPSGWASPN